MPDYKSILCLDGDLPNADFFLQKNLPVIAADGAANSLVTLGVNPDLIIGDLDSVDPDILKTHAYIQLSDQNTNDYQKAMHYLRERDLLPSIVVGIHGGFLDHVLNNINIFMTSDSLLYAPPIQGFVLKEKQTRQIPLPLHSKISLIGMPNACVTSHGLKWELEESQLYFPGTSSCFNRSITPEIILEVKQGSLLVLIYDVLMQDAGF